MSEIYPIAFEKSIPIIKIKSILQSEFKDKISEAML